MLKIMLIILVTMAVFFGITVLSFAQGHAEHEHGATGAVEQAGPQKSIEVGNKICPVSGEKVNEKTKATYEYEGKIYNFCCAMCIDQFQKDPAKYIKKVEAELQAESKSGAQAQQTMSAEEGHEGHYH